MAKAPLFKIPVVGSLARAVGAVPVTRKQDLKPKSGDGPASKVDNNSAFSAVFNVLGKGGSMAIFPEGISHDEPHLQALKTGAARIALGVVKEKKVPVNVVCVGLDWQDKGRFRSSVVVNYSPPIMVDEEWMPMYDEDNFIAAKALTKTIEQRLKDITLDAPDWDTVTLLHTARRIYRPTRKTSPEMHYKLMQRFVEGYKRTKDVPEVKGLMEELRAYQTRLDKLGMRDSHLARGVPSYCSIFFRLITAILFYVIVLPIALVGAVLHLPVILLAYLAGRAAVNSSEMDVISTYKILAGTLAVPLLYIAAIVLTGVFVAWEWCWVPLVVLPIISYITMKAAESIASKNRAYLSVFRLMRHRSEYRALVKKRETLRVALLKLVDEHHDPTVPRLFVDGEVPVAPSPPQGVPAAEAGGADEDDDGLIDKPDAALMQPIELGGIKAVDYRTIITKEGWLKMQGRKRMRKTTVKRWVVLTGDAMRFCEAEREDGKAVAPKAAVALDAVQTFHKLEAEKEDAEPGFQLELKAGQKIDFWAADVAERDDWLVSLNAKRMAPRTPRGELT